MTVTTIEPSREIQSFLNQKHKLLIGGKRVDAINGEIFEVQNPANNSVIAYAPKVGKKTLIEQSKLRVMLLKMGPGENLLFLNEGSCYGNWLT